MDDQKPRDPSCPASGSLITAQHNYGSKIKSATLSVIARSTHYEDNYRVETGQGNQ